MRSNSMRVGGCLVMMALAVCARAADEEYTGCWFIGAEGGAVFHRFETTYEYLNGGAPDEYVNRADGGAIALVFGYGIPLNSLFSLDILGRISGNNAEWTLDTVDEYSGTDQGGPARFTFKSQYSYDLLVRPRISLPANFSVFGEAGLRYGYLHCKKDSVSSTHYNITEWTPGFVAGGGVQFDALKNLSVYAAYRFAGIDSSATESLFPDNTPWERVSVKSDAQSLDLGLVYVF